MATLPDTALPDCTNPQHPPALPRRMIRTYTMNLKVTRKQNEALTRLLGQLSELYNMALQQRRDVYKSHRIFISLNDQQRQLTELRRGVEEYSEFPVDVQRDALIKVDRAFKGFFRRCQSGEKPGYPRFKSRDRYDSFSVGTSRSRYENGILKITKLGYFRVKTRCKIIGKKQLEIRIKRCGQRWQAQVVCDIGPAPNKVSVQSTVGIDLGLTNLVTLSNGTEISNPRWTKQEEERLAEANRDLDRKVRGSNNRARSRERLRRVHKHIVGLRSAYLTGVAKWLVSEYDLIVHEDLKIRNLMRTNLVKSVMDAAWGQLIWRIQCEAEKAGKWVIPVNPRGTTIMCSGCGERVPKTLAQRQHSCSRCGLLLGRDHNAALNIFALGESAAREQKGYLSENRCSNAMTFLQYIDKGDRA
jgi:putative transposase